VDIARGVYAVHAWHFQVHEDDFSLQVFDLSDGFFAVVGFVQRDYSELLR
jgi:hypothetical protein